MAGNIKGITIEIGGDTTGLDKALKGVNSEIKNTQKQLKDVNAALKLDPGNVDLLEQKQRLLSDAVAETTDKLDMLKTAQEQAVDQLARGEIGQEQYDALTREIVKTEAALQDAKKAASDFSVGLEQAKAAAEKVGTAAQNVADKTKKMSAAAAGLLTALGGAAYKAVQLSDDLNTLSKQTGISTEDLQKMAYASDLVDVSVDTIAGSMTKLTKNMASGSASATAAFNAIGVSVTNADGSLRNSSDVFYEVLEGLSQVGNETERDALAMDIFGKSATELAPIIDDGGESLKALGEEASALGLVLDQETLDSLNAVNDKIDQLKAKATGEIAVAGAKAMETLEPVLDAIIEKVSALLEWIGNLDEEQLQTIITVAAVIAAISPIAGLIAGISGAITQFLTIWPQVKAVAAGIKAFAAANPLALVLAAVVALAAIIYTHWDQIKPILEAAWQKVKDVFGKITEKIDAAMETVKSAFESVKEAILGIWGAIVDGVKEKINGILSLVNLLIDGINGLSGKANGLLGAFGLSIPSIGHIPLLANGGVLESGSAIVGDAGPELLTMSNGSAKVTPLTTSTTTINTINNTSQQPLQIELVCDGVSLAKAMYQPMKQVAAQYGPSYVK